MSEQNNGGPAFPGAVMDLDKTWTAEECGQGGMSLRDYFAAKAMAALLLGDGTTHFDSRAKEAYEVADAMLKARTA